MRPLLRALLIVAVSSGSLACGIERPGWFGNDAGDSLPDSATVVADTAGAVVVPAAATPPGGDSIGSADAAGDVPDSVPTGEVSQTVPTIDERLDRLLAGQEQLNRRIDSLAAAGRPNASSGVAVAPGGQLATVQDSAGSPNRLGEARDQVRNFGVAIIWSVIVLAIMSLFVRGLVWLLDALAERNARRRLFYKRLVPIIRIVLWVFTAYFIIHVIFQVDAQGVIAAAAAVGVAVGFAAQDLLKNLFGGFILVFDQPFQTGDKISIGGTYGEVVSIGLRSTRLVTPDDNLVSVPNAQVVDQQVANANAGELNCQVVTDLYLPGWADEAEAKRIAFEAASGSRYVYLKKPIVVLVSDVFKETFLTRVRVKAYVLDPRLEFLLQSDVTERARAGFREAGLLRLEHMRWDLVARTWAAEGNGGVVARNESADTRRDTSVGDGHGE